MKRWWCGRFQRWGLFPCEPREYLKLTSEPCSALLGPQLKAGWPAPNYNGSVAAWGNEERPWCPGGHDFHPLSVHLWCSAPLIARQGRLWGIRAITQTFPLGPQRRVEASAEFGYVWLFRIGLGRTKPQGSSWPVCLWERSPTGEQLSQHMKNTLSANKDTSKPHSLYSIIKVCWVLYLYPVSCLFIYSLKTLYRALKTKLFDHPIQSILSLF